MRPVATAAAAAGGCSPGFSSHAIVWPTGTTTGGSTATSSDDSLIQAPINVPVNVCGISLGLLGDSATQSHAPLFGSTLNTPG